MTVKVIVPNKNYNEKAFGKQFKNGVAEFEDEKKAKAIAYRLGYKVEKVPAKRKASTKKTASKKSAPKKTASKKSAPKKATASKTEKKEG